MAEEQKFTWSFKGILKFLKTSVIALIQGKFLWRLDIGKYFIHVLYTFFLLTLLIFFNLMVETSLNKVEKNKATLHELEIQLSDKTFEVASMSRRTAVESMLKSMGSELGEPEQPAIILSK